MSPSFKVGAPPGNALVLESLKASGSLFLRFSFSKSRIGVSMHLVTGARLVRLLRGFTLDQVASATGIVRSHLSSIEIDSANAGRKAQRSLAQFHHAPWPFLAKKINASEIADAIVQQSSKTKVKDQ
jgi:hypothetical protein